MQKQFVQSPQSTLKRFLKDKVAYTQWLPGSSSIFDISSIQTQALTLDILLLIQQNCKFLKRLQSPYFITSQQLLDALAGIQSLQSLFLDFSTPIQFSLQTLKKFSKIQNLKVRVSGDFLEKHSLSQITSNLSQFESYCKYTKINEQQIEELKKLKNLKEIRLNWTQTQVFELHGLLQPLPHLSSLYLTGPKINNKHLKVIADNIIELKQLHLNYSRVTRDGLQYLLKYSESLETLSLAEVQTVTYAGLVLILKKLKNIKSLSFKAEEILTPQLINCLVEDLSKLEILSVSKNKIGEEWKQSIRELLKRKEKLKSIEIRVFYDSKTAKVIAQNLLQLEQLRLTYGFINNSGAAYISKIKTTKLISVYNNSLGDIGLMKILRNTSVANFQIRNNKEVSQKAKRNVVVIEMRRQVNVFF